MAELRTSPPGWHYTILVDGRLDAKWADWFGDFTMIPRDGGLTLLRGTVLDQAALYGVLSKIQALGLSLLLVMRMERPEDEIQDFRVTSQRLVPQ